MMSYQRRILALPVSQMILNSTSLLDFSDTRGRYSGRSD